MLDNFFKGRDKFLRLNLGHHLEIDLQNVLKRRLQELENSGVVNKLMDTGGGHHSYGQVRIVEALVDTVNGLLQVRVVLELHVSELTIHPTGSSSHEALVTLKFWYDMGQQHWFNHLLEIFELGNVVN